MKLPIYMDNHATTPVDARVLDAMLPCFKEVFGNAASRQHAFGGKAQKLVEEARAQIADLINALPEEIVFTSGATESDNLAIKGAGQMYRQKGNHIISSVTEHKAVLDSCKRMEESGFSVTYIPADREGLVKPEDVTKAITPKTILISIMAANNEIGTIAPVAEIGRIARGRGVLFHCDAAQAVGKIPIDVQAMNIDLLSFSAHKMYGPKGVGALYVRKKNPRVRVAAMMDGGGHENGLRSGTLNVPAIVGFGAACAIAKQELAQEMKRLASLRDRLKDKLLSGLDGVTLNGHATQRLPGNLNLNFAYVESATLLEALAEEIALSSGSACSSANAEPSYVLKAIGVPEQLASCSIRFGLGRFNTQEEVDYVAERLIKLVRRLRQESPLRAVARVVN